LGPISLFSHRTAGALLGLEGIPEGEVEVLIPSPRRAEGVTVHRLENDDRPRSVFVDGFRITNAERTLLDLYSALSQGNLEGALEDALRRRLTTLDRLWSIYAKKGRPGRKGCKAFRAALLRHDARDGTLASRMEAKLRRILSRLPGESAIPQHEVRVDEHRYVIDFAYPDIALGIEAQSLKWHLGHDRWIYDMRRDRRLKMVGWTMLYYPWDDIHLNPDQVGTEIQRIRTELELRLL
jgi:very-short-patch-repair endonuclease